MQVHDRRQPAKRRGHDRFLRALLTVALLGPTACQSPTAPGPTPGGGNANVSAVQVICPATLLVGETSACEARAHVQSQPTRDVTSTATWVSPSTDVVQIPRWGLVIGRAAGQVDIQATYEGRTGSAPIRVIAEDAIRIRAGAEQGSFQRGTTVTMWLQGYYSVASADSGRLSLLITDQDGTVAKLDPRIVARGGDSFVLSKEFVIPSTSTEVCRTAILEVGTVIVAQPQPNAVGRCLPVRP